MDTVKVVGGVVTVSLEVGGTARVRKIRRSRLAEVMEAARYKENDPAAAARFGEMLVRAAVESFMGVRKIDGGPADVISNEFVPDKVLGLIAPREFYDCISEKDIEAILKIANGQMTEEQRGN